MGRPPKTQTNQPEPYNEDFDNPIEDQAEKPKATAKAPEKEQFLKVKDTTFSGEKYIVPDNEKHLWHVELQRAEMLPAAMLSPGDHQFTTIPFIQTYTKNEWRQITTPQKYERGHELAGQPIPNSEVFRHLGMAKNFCYILHVAK